LCPSYYEMIRNHDPDFHLRYRLVMAAQQDGIRAAARAFNCSRNTVRKWRRRFQQGGKPALKEHSRRPSKVPHQTPAAVERRVVKLRQQIPCFGPKRLKDNFDLPCSTGAIARILRQHGLTRSRRKKRQPKNELAAQKMTWPAFSRLQIDVKDLIDLPAYKTFIGHGGLPRYQFTARLVPEGALWLSFSHVNDSTYALLFADRLLAHFKKHGVSLSELTVQTDNGSEFGGNWNRKSLPAFTKLVEKKWRCRQHKFNPPHRSTYNSDVEAVHGIMEPEFYNLEAFSVSPSQFLAKAFSYQLYFNLLRKNSNKNNQTPEQLCRTRAPNVDPKIFYLPAVLLSSARDSPTPRQLLVGHHLPELLTFDVRQQVKAPARTRRR
jgi:transposase-like protein